MKTIKQFVTFLFISTVIVTTTVADASEQSGLIIKTMNIGFGGISISFTTQPKSCSGSFNTMHAFVDQTNPRFNEIMALAGQKRMTKQPVIITYANSGGCTSQSTLLRIDKLS